MLFTGKYLEIIYKTLLNEYGPQGWWPLLECNGVNPTKTGSSTGYHPGEYDWPRTDRQRFEIALGAVLTQNTAWPNVEKALSALADNSLIDPHKIIAADQDELAEIIKPAGYFNMKSRKLKEFSSFYITTNNSIPARGDLLSVWGIGPETADSILLYAYNQHEFVVDAYTRRIFSFLGLVDEKIKYDDLKRFCADGLENEVIVYQEMHALLVEHAKRCYNRKPYDDCLLTALV